MASYSAVSKLAATQTASLVTENKVLNKEFIVKAEKLFKKIQLLLTNTAYNNDKRSLELKLNELRLICFDLIEKDYRENTFYVFDTFHMILKNYIKLLDIDEFINALLNDLLMEENNKLLRFLFEIINHYNIYILTDNMTSKIKREIFFSLFDQISLSTRIVSYLQNKLSLISDDMNQKIIGICQSILYVVLHILYNLKVKLTYNDLEKYQNTLFTPFIIFLDQYFIKKESLRVIDKQSDELIEKILYFIFKIADKKLTIPIFINGNYPQACLRWLSLSYLNVNEYDCIISIIHCISYYDEGASILKKFGFEKIVGQFKNEVLNNKIDFIMNKEKCLNISQTLDLTLILVVDSDELDIKEVKSNIITYLLSTIENNLKFDNFQYKRHHISILLIALMKLCINDNIIHYILQQDQCPLIFFIILKTLLFDVEKNSIPNDDLQSNILAIIAVANIIWSISFHDQYKNDLLENINLIKKLETFREIETINYMLLHIHIPHQMASLKRTMDGIWHNLFLLQSSKIEIQSTENKSIYSLMISYSHLNIDFCRQLFDVLNKISEFSISVDFNNSKYLWKEIIQTIQQSNLILVLISKDFFNSKSCRQELIYITDILKKPLIPIFINVDYKSTGWLDKRISKLKYIRFKETDFMNNCEQLFSIINENLSTKISSFKNSLDIKQWNDKEVKEWFNKNNIISELYEFYQFKNGNELLLYAQAILTFSWTKEYDRIKLRFEEKFKQQDKHLSPLEFSKFINTLELLKSKSLSLI